MFARRNKGTRQALGGTRRANRKKYNKRKPVHRLATLPSSEKKIAAKTSRSPGGKQWYMGSKMQGMHKIQLAKRPTPRKGALEGEAHERGAGPKRLKKNHEDKPSRKRGGAKNYRESTNPHAWNVACWETCIPG